MQKYSVLGVLVIALIIGLTGTSKAQTLFNEDFSSGLNNWVSFGSPSPTIVSTVDGKNDVFDNNGDPNYASGAYSTQTVSLKSGSVIEGDVYLDFSNLSGCWADASIGLSQNENPTTSSTQAPIKGLYWHIGAVGDACWATDEQYRRHAWFSFRILADDGTYESPTSYTISADNYTNSWHKAKMKILTDGRVEFYIDNSLLWTSTKSIDTSVLTDKHIVLGDRSSGSAGKAYIDNILVYDEDSNNTGGDYQAGYDAGYAAGQASCSGDSSAPSTTECASFDFFTNSLHIPCFSSGSSSYWLDFKIINDNPVQLELTNVGQN